MTHVFEKMTRTWLVAFVAAVVFACVGATTAAYAAPAYEDNPHPQIVLSDENPTPVTVKVVSDSVVFDGDAFTPILRVYDKDGNSLFSWTVEADMPSFTDVTNGKVKVAAPRQLVLHDWEGTDVTDKCDITFVDGTFEVTPRLITITTTGGSKVYDGKALTSPLNYRMEIDNDEKDSFGPQYFERNDDEVDVSIGRGSSTPHYGDGDLSYSNTLNTYEMIRLEAAFWSMKLTGTQTNVGQSRNTYSINWGDVNLANYTIKDDLGILKVTSPALSTDSGKIEAPSKPTTQPTTAQTTPRATASQSTNTTNNAVASAGTQNAGTTVVSAEQPSVVAPATYTPSVTSAAATPVVDTPATEGQTSDTPSTESDAGAKAEESESPASDTETIGAQTPATPSAAEEVIEDDETPLADFASTKQGISFPMSLLLLVPVVAAIAIAMLIALRRKPRSSM